MNKYFASRNPMIREQMRDQMNAKMECRELNYLRRVNALEEELNSLDNGDFDGPYDDAATRETEMQFRRLGFRYMREEI